MTRPELNVAQTITGYHCVGIWVLIADPLEVRRYVNKRGRHMQTAKLSASSQLDVTP